MTIKYTGSSDLYEQILDPSYQALFESHTYSEGSGTLTLISGVYSIPANCFYECEFDTMELPEGIVSIGSISFTAATLEEITFPSTLRSISLGFNRCENLTTVTCKAVTPPELPDDTGADEEYINFPAGETLYVPKNSIEAYRNTIWGQKFANILAIPEPPTYGIRFVNVDRNYMDQTRDSK